MTAPAWLVAWEERARLGRGAAAVESLAILLLAMLVHYAIYGGSGQWTDTDSPYHHLLIAEIWKHGWWRDVTWLPYTILGDAGPDHHWLWHLLLSPFAAIDDLQVRIDVVNAFSFALIPAATNLALRLLGVRLAPLWTLLVLAATWSPIFRWSQARAQNLAYAYFAFFLVALAMRNRIALFVIPFLFMHSYHGAAMLAAPALMMAGVLAWRERRVAWPLLLLPAAGGALALVTSPWYPRNIAYFLFHTIDKVGNRLALDVGNEWNPMAPGQVVALLLPQLAVLGVALAGAGRDLRTRLAPETLVALGMSVFFAALTLQHNRFIEYCPQVLAIAAALVVRDCSGRFAGRVRPAFVAAIVATALPLFLLSLAQMSRTHATLHDLPTSRDQEIGTLLRENSRPGDVVLNTQWDEFPFLVAHAPGLRFVTGLDPYYLAYGSDRRFLALARLRGDIVVPGAGDIDVRATFDARWVVTPRYQVVDYLVRSHQAQVVLLNRWGYVVYIGDDPGMLDRLRHAVTPTMRLVWRNDPSRARTTP